MILLLLACARLPAGSDSGDGGFGPSNPPTEPPPLDAGPTRVVNDRDLLPAALDAIAAATAEVRVAQYVAYEGDPVDLLVGELTAAAARGVRVQVLADETGEETAAVLDQLAAAGVDARFDSRSVVLHNKLIVADGVAIVGSHNWTWSALERNHEASILVDDPEVAGWYARWFDALSQEPDAVPEPAPWSREDLRPLADGAVIEALVACIDGADAEVDVVMYAIAWDDRYPGSSVDRVLLALEAAHERGAAVRVVVDGSDWMVDNAINEAAIARLRAAGIDVWTAPSAITTHAKVLRCDGTVIAGDANWSYSGLERYRGTSLEASTDEIVGPMVAWMDDVRSESSPVP